MVIASRWILCLFTINAANAFSATTNNPKMNDNLPASTATNDEPTSKPSVFADIPMGAPDKILGIAENFKKCEDPNKVNVCVGAYRDENGKPWVLPSVREAEKHMLIDNPSAFTKEYTSIGGDPAFVKLALLFAYGTEAPLERIAGVQTLSGTGACRIGGEFLARFATDKNIYLPDPTWGNHVAIFQSCGLTVHRYRYYNARTNALDYEGMMEDLKDAPEGSILLLHACAHNPTGCDPSVEQWKDISLIAKEKKMQIFFDSAYQGFASGDAEKDASALRSFVEDGHSLMLAQSFAKNFGLYGERCGTLSFVTNDAEEKERVLSQLKLIIRPMYSSPPIHGSSIVKTVLTNPTLRTQYYEECSSMADRIGSMRKVLVEKLAEMGSTHDWSHITNQIGMFAYTGMNSDMCDRLTEEFSIFLTRDGRISLAGLNPSNVDYVAKAIHTVTDGKNITQ